MCPGFLGMPGDPDAGMEEFVAEVRARSDFVPPGAEINNQNELFNVTDDEIAKRAQDLRPEDFSE
jgi:hypothetical protein